MIRAKTPEEAYAKALILGEQEQHSYQNMVGQEVAWDFLGIEDLELLEGTIRDGKEIRVRFFRHSNPEELIHEKQRLSVFLGPAGAESELDDPPMYSKFPPAD